jgi:hypothetical protein
MSKLDKWKSIIPLVFFAASILIGASGCSSNPKTSSPEPAKSDSLNEPDSSYVNFTRYARSDTWQKNKLQWLPDTDKNLWQSWYDQNYFIIAGNSQGSKINAAIGMKYELTSPGNYLPSDSVMILSLYSDINSIKTDEDYILVTIEPKSAGYDAVDIPPKPLHKDAQKILSASFLPPEYEGGEKALIDLNAVPIHTKGGLLEHMAGIRDPRKPRGIRHDQTSVLAVVICALLSGTKSFIGIGEWAANLSQEMLKRLGCKYSDRLLEIYSAK